MNPTGRDLVEDDFETARTNLLEIITNGQAAIVELSQLASQSQNDKYFAALSSLMKTVVDANEKLLDIQQKIRNVTKETRLEAKTINNNLIMTTEDLAKLLKASKAK